MDLLGTFRVFELLLSLLLSLRALLKSVKSVEKAQTKKQIENCSQGNRETTKLTYQRPSIFCCHNSYFLLPTNANAPLKGMRQKY